VGGLYRYLPTLFRDVETYLSLLRAPASPELLPLKDCSFLTVMSSPPTSSVRIELAPDPSEMPALVSIFDIAIKASGDKFHEVLMRYAEDHYKETTKRLQAAQSTPVEDSPGERHFVLKAIETVPGYSSGDSHEHGRGNSGEMLEEKAMEEKIVGMATHSSSK
jgi:hypothetical protein